MMDREIVECAGSRRKNRRRKNSKRRIFDVYRGGRSCDCSFFSVMLLHLTDPETRLGFACDRSPKGEMCGSYVISEYSSISASDPRIVGDDVDARDCRTIFSLQGSFSSSMFNSVSAHFRFFTRHRQEIEGGSNNPLMMLSGIFPPM